MNRLLLVSTLAAFAATTTWAATHADIKTGAVESAGVGHVSAHVVVGADLKLDVTFKQIKVGLLSAISVEGPVKNATANLMYYTYAVAFYESDRMIGQ